MSKVGTVVARVVLANVDPEMKALKTLLNRERLDPHDLHNIEARINSMQSMLAEVQHLVTEAAA